MSDHSQPLDPNFKPQKPSSSSMEKFMAVNKIYVGVVREVYYPNNTCDVTLDGIDVTASGCVWAAGVLSGMFGFRTSYLPPPKTKVLVVFTGQYPVYIIGCCPGPIVDPENHARPAVDSEESYHNSQTFSHIRSKDSLLYASQKPPVDLTEGEFQLDNLLGVGLTMLRHMAKLQAGDLAAVECHVLNDMVRIISDTFKHYTAFGDYSIVNDGGKLNVEWHGTAHDHEAWGVKRPQDPKAPLSGENRVDPNGAEGFTDDGRWRFSQYIGWLGNFIHVFVTDPVEQIGRLAEDQIRAGKFRAHVGQDGSVLVQSVADIVLEKVVRIPVPIRIRPQGDPKGNRSSDTISSTDGLKTWQPSDKDNLFEMVFQLREYARWLNNHAAFDRFRMEDKEFKVPTEAETPAPKRDGGEPDREDANKTAVDNWQIAYATIRIYRDGSIQTLDAYGNSFTSTKTGIMISSTTDIMLQSAGSINLVAGQSINLLARKDIGISATTGGLWLRASTKLQLLCQLGNVVVDTLQNGWLKIMGGLNVNNKASIDKAGEINATGNVTALQLAASSTNGPFGDHPHFFHIFQGQPAVETVVDQFDYPGSYAGQPLYETLSQQSLKTSESSSNGLWDFTDNAVPGKGSPWPGTGITQRAYPASEVESLQEPSAKTLHATIPKLVKHGESITLRYV